MNPTRKRRLIIVSLIVAAVSVAAALTALALQQNMTYLFTPSEIIAGKAPATARFRLGGMVKGDSIKRSSDSLKVEFTVTDGDGDTQVEYTGILPDLFREKQSVVTTGSMNGSRFVASEVLAKHDENYVPRDVAEAMKKAHAKHQVPAQNNGATQ
jgi:cytochrome c-type biogenesis protein CcmE